MENSTDFENFTLVTIFENSSDTTFENRSETTFEITSETTTEITTETTSVTSLLTTLGTTVTTPGIGDDIKKVFNNSLSQIFWSQLPAGRKLNRGIEENSCPILKANNTLSSFIPGWEGIPTNIIVNIILTSILLFVFYYFFIRKIYRTEALINAEYIANEKSSDWIHFIYGKRGSKQTLLYNKQINREHPDAYLPIVLHRHRYLVKGSDEEQGVHQISTNLFHETENNVKTNAGNNSLIQSSPTMRSMSETHNGMDKEDEIEIAHFKSILFDEDFSELMMSSESSTFSQQEIDKTVPEPVNTGFGSSKTFDVWFHKYFCIRDKEIFEKKGYDALQYLVFQRYLIYFLGSLTTICLFIILPVNLYAGKLSDIPYTYYRRTTILNVKNESPLIYIHALMSLFVVAMGIFLMMRFSRLVGERVKNVEQKILLIENIPKLKRNAFELKAFLLQKCPNIVIERITFVYDVNKLTSLMLKLWMSIEAKNICRIYQRRYGVKCEVRPYRFGNLRGLLCCCSCYPKVDGLEYYTQEKRSLEKKIEEELKNTTSNPSLITSLANVVIVFVIFGDVLLDTNLMPSTRGNGTSQYAPFPDDINWSEFAVSPWKKWSLKISMNVLILFVFMFLSTPTSALQIVKYFIGYQQPGKDFSEMNADALYLIFWSYVPTLGYTLMTSLLPAVIKILTTQIPCRTKSDYNHAIMWKSYVFLLLMVLILPSLEIITVSQLFESQLLQNKNKTEEDLTVRWSCLFPAENGAFFLNYVLTSAFVGSATELIRIAELASYFVALIVISRTTAEYLTARQNTKYEFYFGTYYPRILLLFTLIVTFSISNPLIAPIGLFYMSIKHMLDRYLIFHAYMPSKISQRIHSKAIVYVYFSLLFLLIQVYTHLASMDYTIPSYIVGTALILHSFFAWFQFFKDLYIFC